MNCQECNQIIVGEAEDCFACGKVLICSACKAEHDAYHAAEAEAAKKKGEKR